MGSQWRRMDTMTIDCLQEMSFFLAGGVRVFQTNCFQASSGFIVPAQLVVITWVSTL